MPSSLTINRRQLLRFAAVGAGGLAVSLPTARSARAANAITLALDWYPNANHAGIYVAQASGTFARADLQLDVYTPSDPTVVLQTVGAGQDTFGVSYQTDVLLAREQGVPVVSIAALVQHPLVCVMSLQSAGITRPSQLKGKTIGYPGIPSQEAYLATMLETDGLTMADIELVNVEFNLLPALLSEQADAVMGAYWTHETILAEQAGYPVNVLRVEEWGVPDFYELVLVTSEETLANRPDMVSAFLLAVQSGYAATIADPQSALEILVTAYPETDRVVEAEGLKLLIPTWTDGVTRFGAQSADRWQSYANWMISRGLISPEMDVNAAFSPAGIPLETATPEAE